MNSYGLKIQSKYNQNDYKEKIMTTYGDVVLFESGIYKIYCDGDTFISHNIFEGILHITCISLRDNINISINVNGVILSGISDVYHKILSQNKDVNMNISVKGVAYENTKIIYRSSLSGSQGSSGIGNQKADFIMLGDMSEIDAQPSLDLATNAIPTAHSVSVGYFDKIDIFYMNLRGLDAKKAEDELLEAFLNS